MIRAQTTLDFAIAMGVFLLTVAFVFTFIPSLTGPFVDGHQDRPVIADRTATHLSEGALGDPDRPFIVQEPCGTAFFGETDAPPSCTGIGNGTTEERLGISDGVGYHIEMVFVDTDEDPGDRQKTVCYDEDADEVIHHGISETDCDVDYEVGGISTADDSTTVARRIVTIDDCAFEGEACDVTLLVEVY